MIKNPLERCTTYHGIYYLDLIANNIEKGGKILDTSFQTNSDGYLIVHITTSYVDDLTKTVDELTYKDDLLITWKLMTSYETHTIFSRKTLDSYLTKENTLNLYVS